MKANTDLRSKILISVIIPSFNRKDRLLKLLEDVSAQKNCDFEVIVVDDCSIDDSVGAVGEAFPEVRIIVNEVNSGCCVTRNRGIRAALGRIIIGLDSDVTLSDDQLFSKVAQAFDSSPGTSGFAFRVLNSEGRADDIPRWWHPKSVITSASTRFETDYFSGTAFAFRMEQLVEAGMFPEYIFQYFEEVEVAFRIIDNGGMLEYNPELVVQHHPGERVGWSDHRFFHSPRSQILLVAGSYPFARGLFYVATRLGRAFLRATASNRVGVFANGVLSGFSKSLDGSVRRKPLQRATWQRISALRN